MLQIAGLETTYGTSQVLFGVTLDVAAGEVVTLLGRNGMGKTTTVNSVMGIVASQGGEVRFDGAPIRGLPSFRVAQLGVGLVPEGRQIFPNLTVLENLLATAANRGAARDPWTVERIFEMFPVLAARRHGMGDLLSGGEQQMLAIGRALMTNPKLLILDEATEGLAPLVRHAIWDCLGRLKEEELSILVIDKNVEDLLTVGDRHFIIEKGRVVWSGDSPAFRRESGLTERYLGV